MAESIKITDQALNERDAVTADVAKERETSRELRERLAVAERDLEVGILNGKRLAWVIANEARFSGRAKNRVHWCPGSSVMEVCEERETSIAAIDAAMGNHLPTLQSPVERKTEREWRLLFRGKTLSLIAGFVGTETQVDEYISHLAIPQEITKQWRTPAGPWTDAPQGTQEEA